MPRSSNREFTFWLEAVIGIAIALCAGCRDSSQQSIPRPSDSVNKARHTTQTNSSLTQSSARFEDVAEQSGISFVPRNGDSAGHLSILESLGVGVGILDYDLDEMLDIFVPGGGEYSSVPEPVGLPSGLFRQHEHLKFEQVAEIAHVARAVFYSHGVSISDFDSDGFPDILMTGYRGLILYHNRGDGTFSDVTENACLTLKSWSTSAAWGDANGDGAVDLYIANYVDWSFQKHPACIVQQHRDVCAPREFSALSDVIYYSNGDGTFRDATDESGLQPGGKGLGVVAADLDLDGDLDYAVANDTTPNFLYVNDGRGHFTESGLISGTAFGESGEAEGSMGIDVGDFNKDGLPDLWVANFENQSFGLYRNEGLCHFQHVSAITGITAVGAEFVGFGTAFVDFDLDGDEDLFAANGHVMNHPANGNVRQKPLLFENLDGKRFVNVAHSAGAYMNSAHLGRGVATADIDFDGDIDLVISHTNEPLALLRNDSPSQRKCLRIRLVGTKSARDGIGARVILHKKRNAPENAGQSSQAISSTRLVKGGASYLSASPYEIVFGYERNDYIDSIDIHWPSGLIQKRTLDALDETIVVIEGLH